MHTTTERDLPLEVKKSLISEADSLVLLLHSAINSYLQANLSERQSHYDVIVHLLQSGADVNMIVSGHTAMTLATSMRVSSFDTITTLFRLLIQYNGDVFYKGPHSISAADSLLLFRYERAVDFLNSVGIVCFDDKLVTGYPRYCHDSKQNQERLHTLNSNPKAFIRFIEEIEIFFHKNGVTIAFPSDTKPSSALSEHLQFITESKLTYLQRGNRVVSELIRSSKEELRLLYNHLQQHNLDSNTLREHRSFLRSLLLSNNITPEFNLIEKRLIKKSVLKNLYLICHQMNNNSDLNRAREKYHYLNKDSWNNLSELLQLIMNKFSHPALHNEFTQLRALISESEHSDSDYKMILDGCDIIEELQKRIDADAKKFECQTTQPNECERTLRAASERLTCFHTMYRQSGIYDIYPRLSSEETLNELDKVCSMNTIDLTHLKKLTHITNMISYIATNHPDLLEHDAALSKAVDKIPELLDLANTKQEIVLHMYLYDEFTKHYDKLYQHLHASFLRNGLYFAHNHPGFIHNSHSRFGTAYDYLMVIDGMISRGLDADSMRAVRVSGIQSHWSTPPKSIRPSQITNSPTETNVQDQHSIQTKANGWPRSSIWAENHRIPPIQEHLDHKLK